MSEFKLCYIEGDWAYFTNKPLNGEGRQWGDDWNDRPYECNAGTPYTYDDGEIRIIGFKGARLETPAEAGFEISVERINQGVIPWLVTPKYSGDDEVVKVFAGATIDEFCNKVTASGGGVYMRLRGC